MKKIFYWLFAISIGIVACTSKPSYEVKLKLTGATGKAYLSQKQNGKLVRLDSVEMVNGEGSMKGAVTIPEMYYIELGSNKGTLTVFLENSVISVDGVADSLSKAKVSGSKTQEELLALQSKVEELDVKGNKLYKEGQEAEKAGNKAKADSLKGLAESLWNNEESLQKNYIRSNPASFISPFVLTQIYYGMDADTLGAYLNSFDPKLQSAQIVKALNERVIKLKKVAIGQIAPDFTMSTVDGASVKLSDIYSKNEYTLVDFWASWCGPCRGENPNVVAVFNEYKAKGFSVLGVSLDTKKENWVKAISDDKLTWDHISDLKGWQNEAANLYAVNSIPANILVDKTGKIVARNLREGKLKETISGLLK